MLIKTIFAGFGGQGVLSMGLNLAQAAMLEGLHVTYLPAYGAEVRGGTANCTVSVSDEEIASPVASSPSYVVAMNHPSMLRFQNQLESGGIMFINSTLIKDPVNRGDIECINVPANAVAEDLGNPRSANMVMLGAFIRKSNMVHLDSLLDGLAAALKNNQKLITINKNALTAGFNLD
ncbi:MAG TPA: 2-oxoacid:acceptor oxidoreductase family protein [Spirochaetota bacterium]|nr:2-oxoacid:acceptor oxidoreductase family protein [Spirochaetota bacterium]HPI91334.1 2-oxoacid:acceptor oxidoreductase family protein [Spirochaetota bacterium]HPR49902.1 2-oxoacid:acceptor oxidoreductase family protein [Spirochaetota bacterium]